MRAGWGGYSPDYCLCKNIYHLHSVTGPTPYVLAADVVGTGTFSQTSRAIKQVK